MKAVDREIRQDVADLLVCCASGIDRRDWALLRSCFTDDCTADCDVRYETLSASA